VRGDLRGLGGRGGADAVDKGGKEEVEGVGDARDDVDEGKYAADREVAAALDAVGEKLEERHVNHVPDLQHKVHTVRRGCAQGGRKSWSTFCRRGACALGSWASWCITANELRLVDASSEAKRPPCRESHSCRSCAPSVHIAGDALITRLRPAQEAHLRCESPSANQKIAKNYQTRTLDPTIPPSAPQSQSVDSNRLALQHLHPHKGI
jgi:hypothetical protein